MSKTTFLFGMLIGAIAVGVREIAFATMAPIQETGQRLAMSSTGRAALNGTFQVPYSSDQGNNDPALDPGVPGDGNVVAYKDTPSTIMLNFYRRGIGWVRVQLNSTGSPASAPPSGPAGGDLSGTYPNPTVAQATKLTTARTINGTSFDGTANITTPAAAETLTGTTLAAGVTASSLTSLGTLTSLTVSGTLTLTGATVTGAPTWGSSQPITLSTAAQPNVTSLGTLTGLNVTVSGTAIATMKTTSASASYLLVGTNQIANVGVVLDNSNGQKDFTCGMRLNNSNVGTLSFCAGDASGGGLTDANEWMTINSSGGAKGAVNLVKKLATYNAVATVGLGVPALYGIDNRTGRTTADGAPITMYTTVAANNIFRVSADIFATAAVTGTANYTVAWTENGTAQTMTVSATAINVLGTASNLIRPDSGTTITAQLTGTFTGTFTVIGLVEQVA